MSFISADHQANKTIDHHAQERTNLADVKFYDLRSRDNNMSDYDSHNREELDNIGSKDAVFGPIDFEESPFSNAVIDQPVSNKIELLDWAKEILSSSPSARTMLSEAKSQGWNISIEAMEGHDFHIDVPSKKIELSDQGLDIGALCRSIYFKNSLLVSLIRALRDVWQEKRYGGFEHDYACENVLMLERIRAADLDILTVLVGWELRAEGRGALWRHLIGSEDGDLAMRFSGYLERDPSSLFNGKALAAAFTQWFRAERRIKACDHETLNYLDALIYDQDFENLFGHKKLTPISVERLSCLPDRTAYLQGYGSEIITDPLYAGLNDPINQAHYMQVLYDLKVTRVQDVPFRDAVLAEKIFPGGEFTSEER